MKKLFPVVDLFAGPGGLSEGFAAFGDFFPRSPIAFDIRLSIENDPVAVETLKLRKFFRSFPRGRAPETYYRYIRSEIDRRAIEAHEHWADSTAAAACLTLGSAEHRREVHSRIRSAVGSSGNFMVIGGPPCQAYSLIGRARMTGVGTVSPGARSSPAQIRQSRIDAFYADTRHTLYQAYLEILAIHRPAFFIMENVKGLLSSKIRLPDGSTEDTFPHVLKDLQKPSDAVKANPELVPIIKDFGIHNPAYRLHSFSLRTSDTPEDLFNQSYLPNDPRDFIVRCELHGIPQKRHRVILLGIRTDLNLKPEPLRFSDQVSVADVIGALPAIRSQLSPSGADNASAWLKAVQTEAKNILNRVKDLSPKQIRLLESIAKRKKSLLTPGAPFIKLTEPDSIEPPPLRQWYYDRRLGGVIQHVARSHMQSDLGRYLFASSYVDAYKTEGRSPTLDAWPGFLLPKHSNVLLGRANLAAVGFRDRFRVQVSKDPATTVTAHIAKDGHYFIHYDPNQCRSLTVREAARLQTFPDNYFFEGNRTDQYRQIGNAVPPFLALQLAEGIAAMLLSDSPN